MTTAKETCPQNEEQCPICGKLYIPKDDDLLKAMPNYPKKHKNCDCSECLPWTY